ncbi:MAG: adenylyl-sulfate kinase [Pseudomonadota bacterium]
MRECYLRAPHFGTMGLRSAAQMTKQYRNLMSHRYLSDVERKEAAEAAREYPSWDLAPQQLCDLELLMNGAFAPLSGFLSEENFTSVIDRWQLADGSEWPIPVTLDVSQTFADTLSPGSRVALRDPEGVLLAILTVESLFAPDRMAQASALYGGTDRESAFADIYRDYPVSIGGPIAGLEPPPHYDHHGLWTDPDTWSNDSRGKPVVAVPIAHPLHQRHVAATDEAMRERDARLLLHVIAGYIPGEHYDRFTRARCAQHASRYLAATDVAIRLLNYAPRQSPARDATALAIIESNFDARHLLLLDDDAPTQRAVGNRIEQLGIDIIRSESLPGATSRPDGLTPSAHDTLVMERDPLPDTFSYPEVVAELRAARPLPGAQGLTVFFTGLSGSGKSTIANALVVRLKELGGRNVTLLDGDLVRKHLSSELGFSREHRDLNIERIGYVASEITHHGGIAVCAPIAPYATTRQTVRQMVEAYGGFIEIHVATPLEVCEQRDRKGLYAKARAGLIKEFTGIDDPYEVPDDPELVIDTESMSAQQAAERVVTKLRDWGYLRGDED